jgi:RIO-like serine/threonine protein kinase
MPDDTLLDLVRNQLTVKDLQSLSTVVSKAAGSSLLTPTAKPIRKRRATSAAKKQILTTVERAIKSSKGLSASEVAKQTKLPQARVTTAIRELKTARRIFQGGDRRFARYAGSAKTAKTASVFARKNVSNKKSRKRA